MYVESVQEIIPKYLNENFMNIAMNLVYFRAFRIHQNMHLFWKYIRSILCISELIFLDICTIGFPRCLQSFIFSTHTVSTFFDTKILIPNYGTIKHNVM